MYEPMYILSKPGSAPAISLSNISSRESFSSSSSLSFSSPSQQLPLQQSTASSPSIFSAAESASAMVLHCGYTTSSIGIASSSHVLVSITDGRGEVLDTTAIALANSTLLEVELAPQATAVERLVHVVWCKAVQLAATLAPGAQWRVVVGRLGEPLPEELRVWQELVSNYRYEHVEAVSVVTVSFDRTLQLLRHKTQGTSGWHERNDTDDSPPDSYWLRANECVGAGVCGLFREAAANASAAAAGGLNGSQGPSTPAGPQQQQARTLREPLSYAFFPLHARSGRSESSAAPLGTALVASKIGGPKATCERQNVFQVRWR